MSLEIFFDNLFANYKDPDKSQAKTRIYVTLFLIFFFTILKLNLNEPKIDIIFKLLFIYLIIGILILLYNHYFPKISLIKRFIILLIDLIIFNLGLYVSDEIGLVLYPLILWVIIGNGMRFGIKHLLISIILGIVSFTINFLNNSYLQSNPFLSLGFFFGILILPLFYMTLINRLHKSKADLKKQIKKTKYLATHDYLTGTYNRNFFISYLEKQIEVSKRNKEKFALIFIDLDKFKEINDTFGHSVGDEVLKEVTKRLSSTLRKSDILCRLGGDEFLILINKIKSKLDVEKITKKILDEISKKYIINNNSLFITSSLGVSFFPETSTKVDELISCADFSMYKVKKNGKNNVSFY